MATYAAGSGTGTLASGIGALAYALHLLTGERWLLVIARRDADGRPGYRTRVRRFEAATLDAAREAIVADLDRAKRMQGMADQFADAFRGLQGRRPGG